MWGAALLAGAAAAAPVIGPVVGPIIGDTRIAPALTAHYEYHYDRNAIRDSARSGDSLVALTDATYLSVSTLRAKLRRPMKLKTYSEPPPPVLWLVASR